MSQSATAHKWLRDGSQGCASARGSRATCWPTCSSPWISLGSKTVFSGCRVCAHIPRVMKRFPGRSSMRRHRTAPRPRPGAAGGTTAYGVSCGRPRSACADPPAGDCWTAPCRRVLPPPTPPPPKRILNRPPRCIMGTLNIAVLCDLHSLLPSKPEK